jgi:hypothetical protein
MDSIQSSVIPSLDGGLGNQLFICIAAYIIHIEKNIPLYIFQCPLRNNKHNIHKINYNDNIFKYIGTHINTELNDYKTHELIAQGYRMETGHKDGFKAWSIPQFNKIILNDYYQFYPPFIKYENEIRQALLKGLRSYSNQYPPSNDRAFLHVRRGDYLQYASVRYDESTTYYRNAIDTILEKNKNIKRIYVVSDDIEWVKSAPHFSSEMFTFFESTNEIETLLFMTSCQGGAICANSTFSWWGAFLGAYESRAPIIVPKIWCDCPTPYLYPDDWIKI